MRQNPRLWMLVVLAGGLVGCAKQVPVDLVAVGQVGVRTMASDKVELPPPSVVRREDTVVVISGLMHRKEGVDEPLQGHLELVILDEQGEKIGSLNVPWQPKQVPTSGDRSASYRVTYGWTPPKGTTLVVTYVDAPDFSEAPQRAAGGRGGGAGGGDGGVIRTPAATRGGGSSHGGGRR